MSTTSPSPTKPPTLALVQAHIHPFLKSYALHRPLISRILTLSFVCFAFTSTYRSLTSSSSPSTSSRSSRSGKGGKGRRGRGGVQVKVDGVFWERLSRLLRIVIPGWRSREAGMLGVHSALLCLRTGLSLYVADLDGRIVSSLVRGQLSQFLKNLAKWLAVAVPATYTNSMLEFIQSKLEMAYRTKLTKRIMDSYLGIGAGQPDEQVFFKLQNLDDRIKNPDQFLVVDAHHFSRALAELYSNIAKPILDVVLFNYQLSRSVGAEGLVVLTVLVQGSSVLLKKITPAFGQLAALTAKLEGELNYTHSRLLANSQEIALYNSSEIEKNIVERSFYALIKHLNSVIRVKGWYSMGEEGIVKWLWSSIGFGVCAIPVFFKMPGVAAVGADLGSRTESLVTNRRLLLSASDAFSRVLSSYKELAELAGYTSRVTELLSTMDDVEHGRYQKRLVSASANVQEHARILEGRGQVSESDSIIFDNVPIVSPNGDVLIKAMSFTIVKGDNLLIVGPNGCGKSSLFRILGGLWPILGGSVSKPPVSDFMFIPQRPYLSLGTLREQIIYPHTKEDALARGMTDERLLACLAVVELEQVVQREGGWEASLDWANALSGGDKQRVAAARLFYHKPKYAILDECTSGVTLEIEKKIYDHATTLGITMLTVSHRVSLWPYHSKVLQYDGEGGYVFLPLDAPRRLALLEEKHTLEMRLAEVEKKRERLEMLKVAGKEL